MVVLTSGINKPNTLIADPDNFKALAMDILRKISIGSEFAGVEEGSWKSSISVL